MTTKNITDLRRIMFDTLQALQDKKNPLDIERALAIKEVGQVIVNSAKVEIDYLKITGQGGSGFIPEELTSAPRLRGETVEPTGHGMKTITHLPGGTTITRHKADRKSGVEGKSVELGGRRGVTITVLLVVPT